VEECGDDVEEYESDRSLNIEWRYYQRPTTIPEELSRRREVDNNSTTTPSTLLDDGQNFGTTTKMTKMTMILTTPSLVNFSEKRKKRKEKSAIFLREV